jgi:hypothetical protein
MTPLLRGFAEHQPLTPIIETMRSLLTNGTPGNDLWGAHVLHACVERLSPKGACPVRPVGSRPPDSPCRPEPRSDATPGRVHPFDSNGPVQFLPASSTPPSCERSSCHAVDVSARDRKNR